MSINAQPFNPTFKLIGNLAADQVLTYDVSENAFVNSTGSGGASVTGFTTAVSQGAVGESIFDTAGSTLQFKSLIGGTDITITDNGTALVINSTLTETLQTGTNLGTGTALYSTNNASNQLQFKSLAVGAGLIINDDGNGTLTIVNTVTAAGGSGADTTLSNLSDDAVARFNLGVNSTTESDIRYLRTDAHSLPQQNNTYDIGSPTLKYNDVHAETFFGTAVLADQLTISGTLGQVLTHNGSTWVAGAGSSVLASASDVSTVAPGDGQHLVWDAGTSLWTPGASGSGGGGYQDSDARASVSAGTGLSYNNATGVMTLSSSISGLTDVDTTGIATGQVLKWNGSSFVASADTDTNTDTTYTAGSGLTLTGTEFTNTSPDQTVTITGAGATTITGTYPTFTITSTDTDTVNSFDGAYASLTGSPSIPTDVSQLTDSSSLLVHTTAFSGVYTDLTSKPTTIAGYGITDAFDSSNAFPYANLTGTPTLPTAVSDLTNDSGFISSVPAQTFASLTSKPTTLAGYGITDASTVDTNTTYTAGSGLTLTGTEFTLTAAHFDGAYASLSGKPTIATDVSQLTDSTSLLAHTTAYTNSDADAHLNTGTATANQVLTWTGSDYDWISSGAHFDGNYSSLVGAPALPTLVSHLTNDSGFITSVPAQTFASITSKPTTLAGYGITDDADTTYTAGANISISLGNVISSTDTNTDTDTTYSAGSGLTLTGTEFTLTDAHFDGAYSSLTGAPTLPTLVSQLTNDAGYLTAQTDSQTLTLTGSTLTITGGNSVTLATPISTIDDLDDVTITGTADGQFLQYNNTSGDWENVTISLYADADVNTHLNTGTATASQVLSWTGTDYDWITSSAGFDGAYSSLTGAPTLPTAVSDLTNDSGFISSVPAQSFTSLTGKPTTLAGYGITDATDTNTTYTAGSGLTLTGTSLSLTDAHFSGVYADLTSKPTLFDGAYSSLTGVPSLFDGAFASLTSKPTTLAGYGITDSYTNSGVDAHLNTSGASSSQILSWNGTDYNWIANAGTPAWADVTGKPTSIAGYGITDAFFDGAFSSLTSKPTTLAGYGITDATDTNTTYTAGSGLTLTGSAFSLTDAHFDGAYASLSGTPSLFDGAFSSLTSKPTTLAGYGITDSFSGSYTDLTSKPTIPSALTDLSISDGTTGQVLTTNGSGAFTFTTVSGGGGASDKISEGNSYVEVIDGGADGRIIFATENTDRWRISNTGHILPETTETYDIGSASKKVRHLYLSDSSLYIGSDTLRTNSSNLLFNGDDVQDYDNLKNKPTIPGQNTGGTGIQVNSGVVSINASLDLLSNVSATSPNSGEVLKWNGSAWAPATDLTSGSSAMNDLTDVDTSGISSGQYLQWNGSAFVAATVSGGGASTINDLSDVDTVTSAPSNGDVLAWSTTDSEWAPTAPAAGSGGASVQYFKLNYATNGNLTSVTNTTSGVSATILSSTGGDVEVTFSGNNYPPAGILLYGYAYASNEYVIMPLNKDISTRKIAGGGSSGNPIAFGSMGSVTLTLKLREADSGASRSFGTTTHAWIMFTMV